MSFRSMNRVFVFLLLVFCGMRLAAQQSPIIPQPQSVGWGKGSFTISACTGLQFDRKNKELQWAVAPLVKKLQQAAGVDLLRPGCAKPRLVVVRLDATIRGSEGYHLSVQQESVVIRAQQPAGIFYAVHSLLQLLPVAVESKVRVANTVWQVPAVTIEDAPRLEHRGLMLDVARHYMSVDSVKRFIDLLARQKMNRFHWHLTDSQGWRFHSKKYPKLTTISAFRKGTPLNTTYDYNSRPNDTLYGGFYTQQQMREVVQYAAERFVTVVPEIEMPAHSRAALAAYPELACLNSNGKPFPYPQQIQDEYCTKEATFTFLTSILSEVMDIFPSQYLHIAGDEAAKTAWKTCRHDQQRMKEEGLNSVEELQSYFVKRITAFVQGRGRKAIGWDEIMQGGLAPGATVMSWTGTEPGIKAAQMGHEVIMTPGEYCYFDHYQSDAHGEPIAWGGLTTLAKVYSYDPVPITLNNTAASLIKGVQGNLWTEFIPTAAKAEYMMFPRAIALAEVGWTAPQQMGYSDFSRRLVSYLKRLDAQGVAYSRHLFDLKLQHAADEAGNISVTLSGVENGAPIYYTLDATAPTLQSAVFTEPLAIKTHALLRAAVILEGITVAQLQRQFIMHKGAGKKATLTHAPSRQYSKGGGGAWHNGIRGSDERFNDDEWLGFNGKAFEGTMQLGAAQTFTSLNTRFFHKPSSWIWVASKLTVQVSDDGVNFTTIAQKEVTPPATEGSVAVQLTWPPVAAKFVRIVATPYGIIPEGYSGAGREAWLFVDEMIIE